MQVSRRMFLAMTASLASSRADAQTSIEEVDLWEERLRPSPRSRLREETDPGGAITGVARPRLRVYRPDRPGRSAIVVAAGGGYKRIEAGKESTPACRWLQSVGVTAFELIYRLPGEVSAPTAPFEDAQRAMRLVRSKAQSFGFERNKIGIMGFSAGGHLAAITAVRPNSDLLPALDDIDEQPARPDFAALLYPVITFMPPYDKTSARLQIVGKHPPRHESAEWSAERQVDADCPPMYLAQAEDDPISSVDNSVIMYRALQNAGVKASLKLFHEGGHGWGLGRPGTEPAAWPADFENWCAASGFLQA